MSAPLLTFECVSYRYPGAAEPALRDVSLELQPGEFCLLAGLSGHGKSTLLRAACGLVPHFHGGRFAGRVTLAGRSTREHGPAPLGMLAGAVFQDPETQLVTSSVRAELALALESRGRSAGEIARGVEGCHSRSASTRFSTAPRMSSPAVRSSVWRSAPPSPAGRRWCCSTSPPRSWTRLPATSS